MTSKNPPADQSVLSPDPSEESPQVFAVNMKANKVKLTRRDFLQLTTIAAAAVTAWGCTPFKSRPTLTPTSTSTPTDILALAATHTPTGTNTPPPTVAPTIAPTPTPFPTTAPTIESTATPKPTATATPKAIYTPIPPTEIAPFDPWVTVEIVPKTVDDVNKMPLIPVDSNPITHPERFWGTDGNPGWMDGYVTKMLEVANRAGVVLVNGCATGVESGGRVNLEFKKSNPDNYKNIKPIGAFAYERTIDAATNKKERALVMSWPIIFKGATGGTLINMMTSESGLVGFGGSRLSNIKLLMDAFPRGLRSLSYFRSEDDMINWFKEGGGGKRSFPAGVELAGVQPNLRDKFQKGTVSDAIFPLWNMIVSLLGAVSISLG